MENKIPKLKDIMLKESYWTLPPNSFTDLERARDYLNVVYKDVYSNNLSDIKYLDIIIKKLQSIRKKAKLVNENKISEGIDNISEDLTRRDVAKISSKLHPASFKSKGKIESIRIYKTKKGINFIQVRYSNYGDTSKITKIVTDLGYQQKSKQRIGGSNQLYFQ